MKEDEEDEQEKTILEKIKKMRRLAGKRRNEGGRGGPNANPAPKRRKVDEANNYAEEIKARLEKITPNMGEKRKIQNVENEDNIDKHKAKRRKKGFQQDIRLFTMINPVDQNDRANDMMKNNITNKIDYRTSAPRDQEIADHADTRSEYSVGVGSPEQSKNSEQGVATNSLNSTLPVPTQCVATGEIVTGTASMELNSGLGTATMTQIVTGTVTKPPELDTSSTHDTQIVSGGEKNDMSVAELQGRLGTAPQTPMVTGEVTSITGFGTTPPISAQGVATGDDVTCQEIEPEKYDMNVAELQDRLGTAPQTQMVTGSMPGRPEYDTDLANDTQCVTRGKCVSYENDCEREDMLGIGKTLDTGMAKDITNDNKCVSLKSNVDNQKVGKAPIKIQICGTCS